jgi:hypothetical protein
VSGLRWLAGVSAGTLLLAGCSGEEPEAAPPDPRTPSTTPVATATASPAPAPPELPAAARRPTKAGAVAFAHHYIDSMNHVAETGDVTELAHLSDPECTSCQNTIRTAENVYGAGGRIDGYMWRVRQYSAIRSPGSNAWQVVLTISASEHRVTSRAGAAPVRFAGGRFAIAVFPEWTGAGWRMARMDRAG